jgi:hypothetical protein
MTQAALMGAFTAYDPPPYPGRIVLFRAARMPWGIQTPPPEMGWSGLAQGGVEVEEMPVYYTTEFSGPNVELLAEKLETRIADQLRLLRKERQPASAAAV